MVDARNCSLLLYTRLLQTSADDVASLRCGDMAVGKSGGVNVFIFLPFFSLNFHPLIF